MLHLTKHHGLGNDFLVALAADNPELVPDPRWRGRCAIAGRGIGADGLLFGLVPSEPDHDACMVLLNSDGSEAEISGNGIRCLAQALLRSDGQGEGTLRIETPGGVRTLRTVRGDVDAELWLQVDMGPARPGPPVGPAALEVDAVRPRHGRHRQPPSGAARAGPGPGRSRRGRPALEADHATGSTCTWSPSSVGTVFACGCGNAVRDSPWRAGPAPSLRWWRPTDWGMVDDRVTVAMPGGDAVVERTEHSMLLTGPAVLVAEVRVP